MREVSGGAAFLANPNDYLNIREGVVKIIQQTEYREEIITKGIENTKQFSPIKIVELYENLYQEIIANK